MFSLLRSLKAVFVVVWRDLRGIIIAGARSLGVIYWGGGRCLGRLITRETLCALLFVFSVWAGQEDKY